MRKHLKLILIGILLVIVYTLGYAAGTNPIWDLERSGCILVVSANLTEEHNVVGVPIKRAVKAGSKLIVIDQREVELTRHATLWLRPRPGTELMLLGGMLRVIEDEVLEDKAFVLEHCENLAAFKSSLARDFDLERVVRVTGIAREQIQEAARLYAQADPAAIVYALDTVPPQHVEPVAHAIADLALLTGNLGKRGGGVYPLRQGANEQGAWDVGCLPSLLPGYRNVHNAAAREQIAQLWQAPVPAEAGVGVLELAGAVRQGRVKTLLVMGDEPSLPLDVARQLEFLVVHATFLSEAASEAHVVLPASTFAEQVGTSTNLERRIQPLRAALEPTRSDAMPGWWVLSQVARAMGALGFDYGAPEQVLEEIGRAVPVYKGISYRRLMGQGNLQYATFPGFPIPQQFYPTSDGAIGAGMQWPLTEEGETAALYARGFPRGKGRFVPLAPLEPPAWITPEFPLLFALGRVLHQPERQPEVQRSPAGGHLRRGGLNQVRREELLQVHPDDARVLDLAEGDHVTVVTAEGPQLQALVRITEQTLPGMVAATTLFGELAVRLQVSEAANPMAHVPTLPLRPARLERSG